MFCLLLCSLVLIFVSLICFCLFVATQKEKSSVGCEGRSEVHQFERNPMLQG